MISSKIVRYLLWSQLSLFLGLGVCFTLSPHFLLERNEGGVSNYGVHSLTILPYSLAFLLGGVLVLLAARHFPHTTKIDRRFRATLYVFGWLLLLILVTTYPYQVNHSFELLHLISAIALLLFETIVSLWFALKLHRDWVNGVLLTIQLLGFVLAVLTYIQVVHVLFVIEIVTSLAFGALLVRTSYQLTGSN